MFIDGGDVPDILLGRYKHGSFMQKKKDLKYVDQSICYFCLFPLFSKILIMNSSPLWKSNNFINLNSINKAKRLNTSILVGLLWVTLTYITKC